MTIQQAYFDEEALCFLEAEVKRLNPKGIFLVTGGKSYISSGAKNAVDNCLHGVKINYFNDFDVNPEWSDVQKGVQELQKTNSEIIIAVGGGSVLDMAKLIRFFNSYNGQPTISNYIKNNDLLSLFAIPTTSGTGAEATKFAVCYFDGTKYSVEHDDILPDYALVYPPFTYNNPKYLTACTAFDALAQSIESFWSVNATQESEEFSLKAFNLLKNNILKVVNNPTKESRNAMAIGSYWAGRAINIAKTTAPHAFSYQFTSKCGYPHGHAVALTFPFFFDLNVNTRKSELQDDIDFGHYKAKMSMLEGLDVKNIIKSIGLGFRGTDGCDIDNLLSGVNVQRLKNNPVKIDENVVERLRKTI